MGSKMINKEECALNIIKKYNSSYKLQDIIKIELQTT